jgi:hypothetical protein
VSVIERAWLITVCSGVVFAVGWFVLVVRKSSSQLAWASGFALLVAVGALLHPSVTYLFAQAGFAGVVLTALVAVMRRLTEHSRVATGKEPDSGTAGFATSTLSSGTFVAGSDESTAIRPRQTSTLDYVPTVLGDDAETTTGSGTGSFPRRSALGEPPP